MHTTAFADIEGEFIARVHRMVWCNVATVDVHGQPRSRVLHTIWEGCTGWIATRRHSPKAQDIGQNPAVSLAYIMDVVRPVYVEGLAHWEDAIEAKQHVWDLFRSAPEPLGYDPASIFGRVDADDFGLLKITPQRIELGDVSGTGERRVVWRLARSLDAGR